MGTETGFPARLRVAIGKRANRWLANSVPVKGSYPFDVEIKLLRSIDLDASVFLDIGANTGAYSELLEDIFGAQNLFLFEPLPQLADHLTGRFPGATVINAALSNRTGKTRIRVPLIEGAPSLTRASLNAHDEPGQTGFDEVEIRTLTLDSLIGNFDARPVGLMKIDVEGHECEVLEGARRLITQFMPLIVVEIEARHHSGSVASAFREFEALDYTGFFIDPGQLELRSSSDFDPDRDQDPQWLERRQFSRYLNNFIFVPESGKDAFVRNANRFLAKERQLAQVWPQSLSDYLARYWIRRRSTERRDRI